MTASIVLNGVCLLISAACVIVVWRTSRSNPYRKAALSGFVPVSLLDKVLEFLGVGAIVLGLVAFFSSRPTLTRPALLPVPSFALPLLTLGLVFWMVVRLRAARLKEQDASLDGDGSK